LYHSPEDHNLKRKKQNENTGKKPLQVKYTLAAVKTTNLSVLLVSTSVSGEVNEKWNSDTKMLVVNDLFFVLYSM
jgi:hypothetical protein